MTHRNRKQKLTPPFRSNSLTMFRADILADGVSGELLPKPFDRTVQEKQRVLFYLLN